MKKILIRTICVFLFALTVFQLIACKSSYSSDSLKSNLEKAGYKVDTNPIILNLETSKMEGYQSSLYGYKIVDNQELGVLILIFDTTEHANKVGSPEGNVATETVSLLHDWGRKHATEDELSVYGVANNIIWTGSTQAKDAAKIK